MRFMILVKAGPESEASRPPSQQLREAMSAYNEALVKAGVRVDRGGLHPSSDAIRVTWPDGKPTRTDGPFAETKELIAGYFILDVDSREEAIEWAMRCPKPHNHPDCQIELRQIFANPVRTDGEATKH